LGGGRERSEDDGLERAGLPLFHNHNLLDFLAARDYFIGLLVQVFCSLLLLGGSCSTALFSILFYFDTQINIKRTPKVRIIFMRKPLSKNASHPVSGLTKLCQQLFITLVAFSGFSFFCNGCAIRGGAQSTAQPLEKVLSCGSLRFVGEIKLDFDTFHVQGLEIAGQYGYVTSVNTKSSPKKGWLFKINISDGALVQKRDLTEGDRIHPGGLQYDGRYLWIPVAEYRRQAWTTIVAVDPKTLKTVRSFSVNDHIGALASDGKNRLFGFGWDAERLYVWNWDGDEIEALVSPAAGLSYQDVKFLDGMLLCCGHRGRVSAIDLIDVTNWELKKRIILPRQQWLSREGMTYHDGKLYFLPYDGPNSKIFIFELKN